MCSSHILSRKQRFTALWPLSGSYILSVSSSETFPEISLSLQVCLCVCIIVLAHVYAEHLCVLIYGHACGGQRMTLDADGQALYT